MSDPRSLVREALRAVAPEADFEALDPDRPIRDQVELDSMDSLNFLIRLKRLTGVEIPAGDAGRDLSLNGLIGEIRRRASGRPANRRIGPRSG